MNQLDILKSARSGALSAAEVLEQLKSIKSPLAHRLSEGQRGLWMLEKIAVGESGYNIPLCIRFRQKISVELLHEACEFIWTQYPILRTVIEEVDGEPQQRIAPWSPVPWVYENAIEWTETELNDYLRSKTKEPFVLDRVPLLRIYLLAQSKGEHIALIVIHHIVFDGSSVAVLLRSMLDAYARLQRGERVTPRVLPASYREFVAWEQSLLTSEKGRKHSAYWQRQLSGALPVLELPTDHSRAARKQRTGRTFEVALSAELSERVRSLSAQLHVSMSVVCLGVYHLLLHRYSGERDLIVGMPTAGRPQARFDGLIGYFVNMIAVRTQIDDAQPFAEWLRSLQFTLADGMDHAAYPFSRVVSDLHVRRDVMHTPVFQVAYEYQNASMLVPHGSRADRQESLNFEAVPGLHQEGEYELVLEVIEQKTGLALNFKYDVSLFEQDTIARLAGHYVNILSQAIAQPNQSLSAFTVMTASESNQLLVDWNATDTMYAQDRCLHDLIREQAMQTPDVTAVVFENQSLTYRELNERSDQLAADLRQIGVQVGDRVGLCIERSLALPIGLLGILKSGAAYVPLDPTYPSERLHYMLRDSNARCVVTQSSLTSSLDELLRGSKRIICLDQDSSDNNLSSSNDDDANAEFGELLASDAAAAPLTSDALTSDALAYVMYTSGSTGRPKGVMITHRSLINCLVSMSRSPGMTADDRLLAVTTYSFDIAGLEIYLPLLVGATCHICGADKTKDVGLLKREISRVRPTVMQATPTTWSMLLQIDWRNDERIKILCGGEALPSELRRQFVDAGWEAWNLYGPTETTIWSTIEKITAAERNTIGKPIANTQIYILDSYGQPTSILVPGELCIAGDGLALGYLNQPALTAEKFIENPFNHARKLYKTGDLACWRADGTIEYIGRMDAQIKLRGYRIELGEIETCLATHPQIQTNVVVLTEAAIHPQLTAYCVLKESANIPMANIEPSTSARALREYLRAKLPEYMLPARFVVLTKLPLTPNGKVDRKQLTNIDVPQGVTVRPGESDTSNSKVDATHCSQVQQRILKIWQRALAVEAIDLDEGFFTAGGDSVLAVTVADRIKRELGCAFSVTDLFRFSTIRQIAQHLMIQQMEVENADVSGLLMPEPSIALSANNPAQKDEKEKSIQSPDECRNSVAIIGISCQFPGAEDHRRFWNNLVDGVESIQLLAADQLRQQGVPEKLLSQSNYVAAQSSIVGKEYFDAEFFKISRRDAQWMDPQLRLLLQHAWKAVEDAGYSAQSIPDTSVYISTSQNGYTMRAMAGENRGANALQGSESYVNWLLAQSGTIPTMISHRLGFKGPSLAIHANCSSSLVGLQAAYQTLLLGTSKQALVGAATIFADNSIGYMYQKGLNFSSDGHVKTFDASADGMVGGEGVAVVLLKRTVDAIADGDHIYALIRGIAVNNDGADKAGFYAPSVAGQVKVIGDALNSAQIDPRSISYVEAHGTGTELGDPIELAAITAAYRQHTDERQFCGIGSVKTNIGHVDTAAGLAGLIKVALCLEHRELPPSLHYRTPNPKCGLEESPFYVVDRRTSWRQEAGPRRAALSSFGVGGTNTHAILEEAPERLNRVSRSTSLPMQCVVPLSARNEERLDAYVRELHEFLQEKSAAESAVNLTELAYTLQVGRRQMDARVAFVVSNMNELIQKLEAYRSKEVNIADCFVSTTVASGGLANALNGVDTSALVAQWIAMRESLTLAKMWVNGLHIEWAELYAAGSPYMDNTPRRVSLPTYPFARERYWIDDVEATTHADRSQHEQALTAPRQRTTLHPLLHENTSDFSSAQKFTTTLTGEEFFLRDHIVRSRRVLPGVTYLEMARAAIKQSISVDGKKIDERALTIRLKNVVWPSPVRVDEEPVDVHIELIPEESGEIVFEIYSVVSEEESTARTADEGTSDSHRFQVHCQGRAIVQTLSGIPRLDLRSLREECSKIISAADAYAALPTMGFIFGPSFRALHQLHVGVDSEGRQQIVAEMAIPEIVLATHGDYVLHPSLMDAAIGALPDTDVTKPTMPFVLGQIDVFAACQPKMVAFVRYASGSQAHDTVTKFDIDLCDLAGNVCVSMKEYSRRVLDAGKSRHLSLPTDIFSTPQQQGVQYLKEVEPAASELLLATRWDMAIVDESTKWPSAADRILIVGGTAEQQQAICQRYEHAHVLEIANDSIEEMIQRINAQGVIEQIVWVAPQSKVMELSDERLIEEQTLGVLSCFRLIKALLALGYGQRALGWSVVTWQTLKMEQRECIYPMHASVHGLIGALAKEYANWKVRLVDLAIEEDWPLEDMLRLPADAQGNAWGYRQGEWYRQQLLPYELKAPQTPSFRREGVYVMIGGAGGIGEVFSEYLIRNYQAQIVWIGRRDLDETIQAKLNRLSILGPVPQYISADATDRAALENAYENIKTRHGRIHGVIHAAIVLLDKSLANMDEQRFRAGLAAKVDVSVRFAQVFAPEPLDFVLFFSSLQSFTKMAGQSNYAAGCTFSDAFANRMAQNWPCAVKVVNWGYWGGVGIVASEEYRARMTQLGMGSIEPTEGMAVLEKLFGGAANQLAYLKTISPTITEAFAGRERLVELPITSPAIKEECIPDQPLLALEEVTNSAAANGFHRKLDELLAKLLCVQLQSLGLFVIGLPAQNDSFIERWKQEKRVPALYDRWLSESLRVLGERGYLRGEATGATMLSTALLDHAVVWSEWEERRKVWLEDASCRAQINLVDATLRALPQILIGKTPATDIIFPNSSMERVEGLYKNNPLSDYFNDVLAHTLVAYVVERVRQDPSVRIRILEIGAGTGGTSAKVLAELKPYAEHIEEYCYTDVSKAFLMHAERQYGPSAPYLTYRLFNVEQQAEAQSIDVGAYDVAIAANVLHATKNIRQTLRNSKTVLKKHGLLLLNEMSTNALFTHLTFGLLEGWWLYEDVAVRIPGTPGLYPDSWRRVLECEGFQSIVFPAQMAHGFGQQIIAAQSDGIIRQKLLPSSHSHVVESLRPESPKPQLAKKVLSADRAFTNVSTGVFRDKAITALKKLVGDTLKMPVSEINANEPLETYGVDSILVVTMTNALNQVFSNVASTIFFEHQTIEALVDHFVETDKRALLRWVGMDERASAEELISNDRDVRKASSISFLRPAVRGLHRNRFSRGSSSVRATTDEIRTKDIAIIGLSGRYPMANNVLEFWNNLKDGKNCIREIPKERWDWQAYYCEERGKVGSTYTKWGGFIDEIDKFDPLFFRLSPREAEQTDPQERLFLQEAYASIEDAGYTPGNLSPDKNVGVYVGVTNSTYPRSPRNWSIANRVSYILDFHGPSMAVDTACSSSLTAIHLAVESLTGGNCACAIVGGVNLIVDPIQYITFSAMTMLSSGDRCKSFGDQADGFVDAEGVGAVVLKPLHKAAVDGDHVYGVIKVSTVNAGGKTSGYSVPNPAAQAMVILDALQRADIDPRTISYIEAHGTGTSLGDPIEIAGLTKAFSKYTTDKQYCAIGSAKSNIGHCESAAGIAGLTKVLLQFKYQTLVPSLHSAVLNPHIDFKETPFVVQQSLTEWKRPVIEIGGQSAKEYPRLAGISSFGAGGANAHVIVEEYRRTELANHPIEIIPERPALIVLSAKNEERLKEQVSRLAAAIIEENFSDTDLANIAYTLQVGREAMEQRLALSVVSIKELQERLNTYLNGEEPIESLYRGDSKKNKEMLSMFNSDNDAGNLISLWLQKGKYSKLLELWVKGLVFDWSQLYLETRPQRISLPTYPFARERYWVERKEPPTVRNTSSDGSFLLSHNAVAVLHPLLQENTSDLGGLRFTSTFTGEEFFLKDHVIQGARVLPGVCYLEMVRAAVLRANSTTEKIASQQAILIKHVVWLRPIVIDGESIAIHVGLYPEADGELSYEIYSVAQHGTLMSAGGGDRSWPNVDEETIIHSQGRVFFGDRHELSEERHDLSILRAGCDRSIDGLRCYSGFAAAGLAYGSSFQGIESVSVGRTATGERYVLAAIKLPPSLGEAQDQYVLHPSMLDSALQASIGLVLDDVSTESNRGIPKPMLPFALDAIEIFDRSPIKGFVYVRPWRSAVEIDQASLVSKTEKIRKLDIDICDENGQVCVRLKGLTGRVLQDAITDSSNTLLLERHWQAKPLDVRGETKLTVEAASSEQWILLDPIFAAYASELQMQWPGVKSELFGLADDDERTRIEFYGAQLFTRVQAILQSKLKGKVLLQVVLARDPQTDLSASAGRLLGALIGLLKSAQFENPKFAFQAIEVDARESVQSLMSKLAQNAQAEGIEDQEIRYVDEKRFVASFKELLPLVDSGAETQDAAVTMQSSMLWKNEGVYLITGGAGGLGLIFAGEIASKVKEAKVILTGRSLLNDAQQTEIKSLERNGTQIEYRLLDVTDSIAVTALVQQITDRYRTLDGVIHSAGIISDNFIIKKTVEEFNAVLAPKVSGVVYLDQATAHLRLGFFVTFSSIAGAFGSMGQADYALANAFMDRYAEYRGELVKIGRRQGRSLSINWPLWADGGMQGGATAKEQMLRHGMHALSTEAGIDALYHAYRSEKSQVIVLRGTRRALQMQLHAEAGTAFAFAESKHDAATAQTLPSPTQLLSGSCADTNENVVQYLKNLLAGSLKLSIDRIETDVALETYGIDSIAALKLVTALEEVFGSLSKTLFFEYESIDALAEYFSTSHRERLNKLLGSKENQYQSTDSKMKLALAASAVEPVQSRHRSRLAAIAREAEQAMPVSRSQSGDPLDIAIIGLSGRYPQADNVYDYWENLKASKDCISEIPQERWLLEGFFEENRQLSAIQGRSYCKWGGFINDVEKFDADFFGEHAAVLERGGSEVFVLLQTIWTLLESAGYTREQLKRRVESRVGVYVGAMADGIGGTSPSVITNGISGFFALQGPSVAIDTMSSSSMTAVHMACEGLVRGDCKIAIAAGIHLLQRSSYINMTQLKMLGSHANSRSFADGDGILPAEGIGAVLLKPLSQAIADKDILFAVIKATTINHSGSANVNLQTQERLVADNLAKAKIDPRTISYVEAGANGSPIGDAVEIAALAKVFLKAGVPIASCPIGSVKANIGHAVAASGMSQLTKVILQMRHKRLAPTILVDRLNRNLSLDTSPFFLQQSNSDWNRPIIETAGKNTEYPRRAIINSFGAGGSYVNVIVEESPLPENLPNGNQTQEAIAELIVVSARSREHLRTRIEQIGAHIEKNREIALSDLAYTLQIGREAMEFRWATVVNCLPQLLVSIEKYLTAAEEPLLAEPLLEDAARVFTGHRENHQRKIGDLLDEQTERKLMEIYLTDRNLNKIAFHWVNGGAADWDVLYRDKDVRRITLPTYPFSCRRINTTRLTSAERAIADASANDARGKASNEQLEAERPSPRTEEIILN